MNLAILCTDLHKTYPGSPPVEAVRGLDLQVERGECFGLLGPNGAGKTTTIEILEGLLRPTSGSVEVLELEWNQSANQIRQHIGISLQETQLSEKLSVRETLNLFRSFYENGITPQQAIAQVSLEEKADAWVGKLSGGQKQRLAVACALVGNPDLLFLDEPTTGLDPQSRRQIWEIIRQFRGAGKTVLLTTHYMDEAERLCHRIGIVDRGQVIALGTPRELIASIGSDHIVEFSLNNNGTVSLIESLEELPSVSKAAFEDNHYRLSVSEPHILIPALMDFIREHSHDLASLNTRHASLEDVFVHLTGRHLRDTAHDTTS